MKKILSTLFVMMAMGASAQASQARSECALIAAQAAATYAAKAWNTTPSKVKIISSDRTSSSNPPPIEIYAVGIKGPWGNSDLFNVAVDNNADSCVVVDVSPVDFL